MIGHFCITPVNVLPFTSTLMLSLMPKMGSLSPSSEVLTSITLIEAVAHECVLDDGMQHEVYLFLTIIS